MRRCALVLVFVLSACATAQPSPSPFPTEQPTATPTPTPSPTPTPRVYWPLRGTLAPSPEAIRKRPVVVRIGNDSAARPQSGLSKADMVWELLVEGGITRYMAVFHSEDVDEIGPIRSARLSDLQYAPMLRAILAHVGASTIVLSKVNAAAARGEFINVDEVSAESFFTRVTTRKMPQNAYTSSGRLRAAAGLAGDTADVDVPALPFAICGGPCPASTPAHTFTIPYLGAQAVTYTFEPAARAYHRTQGGSPTIDATTGEKVTATSVIVIFTDITPQPGIVEDVLGSVSLDIRTTGAGAVAIFDGDGVRRDGTWSRQGSDMYRFTDASGAPLTVWPGQTWVHVIPSDWKVPSAP